MRLVEKCIWLKFNRISHIGLNTDASSIEGCSKRVLRMYGRIWVHPHLIDSDGPDGREGVSSLCIGILVWTSLAFVLPVS